jgi:ribosomal protein L7Ae-like RNA K-turn-binding protein
VFSDFENGAKNNSTLHNETTTNRMPHVAKRRVNNSFNVKGNGQGGRTSSGPGKPVAASSPTARQLSSTTSPQSRRPPNATLETSPPTIRILQKRPNSSDDPAIQVDLVSASPNASQESRSVPKDFVTTSVWQLSRSEPTKDAPLGKPLPNPQPSPPVVAASSVSEGKLVAVSSQPSKSRKPKKKSSGPSVSNCGPTTTMALSKLLAPKKDAPVHVMDAHHSAAMLGCFSCSVPPSATNPSLPKKGPSHATKASSKVSPTTATTVASQLGAAAAAALPFWTGNGGTTKGRQRVRPRQKKFTALKKKVLQERLRQWQELHTTTANDENTVTTLATTQTCTALNGCDTRPTKRDGGTVCLLGFVGEDDDLEDDDEYQEIVDNLRDMALPVSKSTNDSVLVFVPRYGVYPRSELWPAFVKFGPSDESSASSLAVDAAVASWNGLILGGQALQCRAIELHPTMDTDVPNDTASESEEAQWQAQCLAAMAIHSMVKPESATNASLTFDVLVDNALTEDDMEDEDCLAESLHDLRVIASKCGAVESLRVDSKNPLSLRITYRWNVDNHDVDSSMVVAEWNKVSIGGQQLVARIDTPRTALFDVLVDNALTEDDLEDEDCMAESLQDLRVVASKYGTVESLRVDSKDVYPPTLRVTYQRNDERDIDSSKVVAEWNKVSIGGHQLAARIATADDCPVTTTATKFCGFVCLQNVLTADDLEDDDCLQESLNDIRELAMRFGQVDSVVVEQSDKASVSLASECTVRVCYSTLGEAKAGVVGFNGTVIGGNTVSALLDGLPLEQSAQAPKVSTNNHPETMFSGDKIVSERFAACKRVPKIPNKESTRVYATLAKDEAIKTLLIEMLGELMRLQKRAVEDKNAKARRRLVIGLREVARGIRAHKVKMVVMANNLDEYGIIDQTLQEIIDLCRTEEVPVFYEFTKRALGKALGKTIKVAVAGIQNADGAHQQFKKLMQYAAKLS